MDPVLSVIIPCYNGKSYVRRAVESVTTQPESAHIEILIVNDGSTDGTDVVCNALASEYANVHVFHKENGGVSRARNLGIEKASGHYIAFLDCDDWWEPGFLDAETISALDPQNVPPPWTFINFHIAPLINTAPWKRGTLSQSKIASTLLPDSAGMTGLIPVPSSTEEVIS